MALVTSTSGPKYAIYGGAVVSGPPFSVSLWVYPLNTTEDHYVWAMSGSSGSNNHMIALYGSYTGLGTDVVAAITDDGSPPAGYAVASGSFSANTWQHVGGVWAASNDRRCYRAGANKGTDSTNRNPTPNRTLDGAVLAGGAAYGSSCRIAMRAAWNVALSDDEMAALAAGLHPLLVRPASLVSFCPFGNFEGDVYTDRVGGFTPTGTNSPTFDDGPRIIYPVGTLSVNASSAAAASAFRRSLFMRAGSRGVI